MQQSPQMFNSNAAPMPPTTTITTEQIQQYLDENKQLILAIMENQNMGKFAECALYQAQLQENLTFLAKIADAQPQAPTTASQMPPQSDVQHGHYMLHSQAAMSQQQPVSAPRLPFQFNDVHQQQHQPPLFQQQLIQGQMGMRPGATCNTPSL